MTTDVIISDMQGFYEKLGYILKAKHQGNLLDSDEAYEKYYTAILNDLNSLADSVNAYKINEGEIEDDGYVFAQWLKVQVITEIEKQRKSINKKYLKFLDSTYSYKVTKPKSA